MATILVVDDDPQTRQLYVSLLSPFGHQVLQAGDGVDGLTLAQKYPPDLVVSDILMPTMNGYEFASSLRKLPQLERAPLIFQSASFLDHQSRALGAACGVNEYLAKPTDPEKILEMVNRVLGLPAVQLPSPPTFSPKDPVSVLIDAFYEKGKKLDAVSMRLAALLELGLQMSQSNVPQELLEKTASAARKIIGADYAAAGVLKSGDQAMKLFVTSGMGTETVQNLSKPVIAGTFREIAVHKKVIRMFSPVGELKALQLPAYHPLVRGFLGVPIQTATRVYGLIYVADKLQGTEFVDEDERLLATIAAKLAVAYESIQRYQDIQEQAERLRREIEQRKQAEERFRLLVETAPTGILICDGQGNITEANAQLQRMFGYKRRELVGQPVEMLVPAAHRSMHTEHRTKFVNAPETRPMGLGMELSGCRKDGTTFPVEISLGSLTTQEGTLISSTVVDISERKKLEKQLQVSQRLEAVGQLAAGIAHDFNNILTAISGNTKLAAHDLTPDHPVQQSLNEIEKAGSRARELVHQILTFSRQQESRREVIQLATVIDEVLKLLRATLPANIEILSEFNSNVPAVSADTTQVHQVLMNLATNAADAMQGRGVFKVRLESITVDNGLAHACPELQHGDYVRLSVIDDGCGMDPSTTEHIFEPFYTTKSPGKGTGLGLSVVHGIMKNHGGTVTVYSEPGKGTVFHLYFPATEATAVETRQRTPTAFRGQGQRVLYIDNEESLVLLVTRMLPRFGYEVSGYCDPRKALETFRSSPQEFDAVVSDLSMPGMSGIDLARELLQIRPGLPILIASGYIHPEVDEEALSLGLPPLMLKPYTLEELGNMLQAMFGKTQSVTERAPAKGSLQPAGRLQLQRHSARPAQH